MNAKSYTVTLVTAFVGAALAALAGIPAGALIGSTLAVVAVAATGQPVGLPDRVRDVAFATIGLPQFGFQAPPRLTEGIQHGVFKYFIPPVAIYAALGGIMAYTTRKNKNSQEGGSDE